MKDQKKILADWLRDAHAMESNLVNMLETQAGRLDDFPALQKRIADHAEESKRQAERVEECLKGLDENTSTLKESVAKVSGKLGPFGSAMASDEPVKICLANIAAEHFEMASYRSLRSAAEHCGEMKVAQVAGEILAEEESMAKFLEEQLGQVTNAHLEQHAGAGSRS